jgi:hypothetical protein
VSSLSATDAYRVLVVGMHPSTCGFPCLSLEFVELVPSKYTLPGFQSGLFILSRTGLDGGYSSAVALLTFVSMLKIQRTEQH